MLKPINYAKYMRVKFRELTIPLTELLRIPFKLEKNDS